MDASLSNAAAADKVVAAIEAADGKAVALPLDVGNADSFGAFKEAVIEALASTWDSTTLHGLVNNAGYGLFNPIEAVTAAQSAPNLGAVSVMNSKPCWPGKQRLGASANRRM